MASLAYHIQQRAAAPSNGAETPSASCFVLGVMSGTSLDGVDLCVIEVAGVGSYSIAGVGGGGGPGPLELRRIVAFRTVDFPATDSGSPYASLRGDLQAIMGAHRGASADAAPNTQLNIAQLMCRANFDWSRFVGDEILRMVNEELIANGDTACDTKTNGASHVFGDLADAQRRLLVGSHGQTVWHENNRHSTLQIGDTEVLAQTTGMAVVGNFRAADVAVGGCGAPLVPFFDRLVASHALRDGTSDCIAFQNLGGIGNVTFIRRPPTHSGSSGDGEWYVSAFDTGPANVALNEFIELCAAECRTLIRAGDDEGAVLSATAAELLALIEGVLGASPKGYYDRDAAFSSEPSSLEAIAALLKSWGADESDDVAASGRFAAYFAQPPPKTAGREQFGAVFARHLWDAYMRPQLEKGAGAASSEPDDDDGRSSEALAALGAMPFDDAFRTICRALVELTCASVADAYARHLPAVPPTVVVSGGGKHHSLIMSGLARRLTAHRTRQLSAASGEALSVADVRLLSLNALLFGSGDDSSESPAIDADDAKEAVAFAVLAHERLNSYAIPSPLVPLASNVPSATGASRGVVLGQVSVPF